MFNLPPSTMEEMRCLLRNLGRGKLLDQSADTTGLRDTLAPGEAKRLIQLRATNRASPPIITVTLDVQIETEAAEGALTPIRLLSSLAWESGKGACSALIDTRRGAQVTLCANTLVVESQYASFDPALPPIAGIDPVFLVSAAAVYGSRPGAANPMLTLTGEVQALAGAPAVSGRLEIPAYATAVAWTTTSAAAAANLRFFPTVRPVAPLVAVALAPGQNEFVPVPNGAYFVEIQNAAVGAADYRLIFEIGL